MNNESNKHLSEWAALCALLLTSYQTSAIDCLIYYFFRSQIMKFFVSVTFSVSLIYKWHRFPVSKYLTKPVSVTDVDFQSFFWYDHSGCSFLNNSASALNNNRINGSWEPNWCILCRTNSSWYYLKTLVPNSMQVQGIKYLIRFKYLC